MGLPAEEIEVELVDGSALIGDLNHLLLPVVSEQSVVILVDGIRYRRLATDRKFSVVRVMQVVGLDRDKGVGALDRTGRPSYMVRGDLELAP